MSKSQKKRTHRGKTAKRRRERSQKRQQQSRKISGGKCGCGMKGGSFAPSFSGLSGTHYYPQNTFQNDPSHMAISSRTLPNTPMGMSVMKGGRKQRRHKKQQRGTKKMRGGINPSGLMASAYSTILGNGLYDNPVVNQGGMGGMITSAQIMNGSAPQVMPNGPDSIKLYNQNNPPMA